MIKSRTCDGYFGDRKDLKNAVIIEDVGHYLIIKTSDGELLECNFTSMEEKDEKIAEWTS
jgi:hypothetical protein